MVGLERHFDPADKVLDMSALLLFARSDLLEVGDDIVHDFNCRHDCDAVDLLYRKGTEMVKQ